ncbi:MAG TPA: SIMPL domain-containing protein [Thermoleophilaceae bacterium]|nr:SIMPL domain-containing protein [Thermoleophilaceae bacterium]
MTGFRAIAVAVGGVAALAAPGPAQAQGVYYGPFPPQEEYPPGITVSGGGLARVQAPVGPSEQSIDAAVQAAKPRAVGRAVRDARRRAETLAAKLGVELGATTQVEVREPFFEQRRRCSTRTRLARRPCDDPAFTAAAVTVSFAVAGGADGDADTVEAYATAPVPVEPAKPGSERSIRRALLEARDETTPAAAALARARVDAAAAATGTAAGTLVSVVEQNAYYADVSLGAFGARRYCRMVRHRRFLGLDPETGRPRIRRGPLRRRCFYPRRLDISVKMTYTFGTAG